MVGEPIFHTAFFATGCSWYGFYVYMTHVQTTKNNSAMHCMNNNRNISPRLSLAILQSSSNSNNCRE